MKVTYWLRMKTRGGYAVGEFEFRGPDPFPGTVPAIGTLVWMERARDREGEMQFDSACVKEVAYWQAGAGDDVDGPSVVVTTEDGCACEDPDDGDYDGLRRETMEWILTNPHWKAQ